MKVWKLADLRISNENALVITNKPVGGLSANRKQSRATRRTG